MKGITITSKNIKKIIRSASRKMNRLPKFYTYGVPLNEDIDKIKIRK